MNGRTNSAGGALVSDMEIPLDPCTDFVGVRIKDLEYLGKVRLTWTDPKDKYATPEGEAMEDTDQLVSKWSYTQIVRQADRAPVNPSDGVTVCTETTRNQYQLTGFVDTTAESNVTYYYGAYAFNEDGVYSEVISNGVQPVSFSTTLADNTWEEIDQACTLGLAESLWEIGDEKELEYYDGGPNGNQTTLVVILDFNHDDLSDGSGKAVMSFASKSILSSCYFHTGSTYNWDYYNNSTIRTQELDILYDNEPSGIKPYLKQVKKYWSYIYGGSNSSGPWRVDHIGSANDYFFIFSISELNYYLQETSSYGHAEPTINPDKGNVLDLQDGYQYPYFSTAEARDVPSYGKEYWLRNTNSYTNLGYQRAYCKDEYDQAGGNILGNLSYGLRIGFCIGKVAV